MAICCPKPVRACALRATLLDECGIPLDVAAEFNTQIVTKQFIQMNLSPDIEEGEEFRVRNACGNTCIDDKSCDELLGFDLTLELCNLPPHLLSMISGLDTFVTDAGDVVGGVFPSTDVDGELGTLCNNNVMLEVWSGNSDNQRCQADGTPWPYVRWILPLVTNGQLGNDITFENGPLQFSITAEVKANGSFDSPLGLVNDPDLNQEMIDQIRAGGPLAFVCTDTLPDIVECNYVNPAP